MALIVKFFEDKQKEGEIISVGYIPVDTKARKDSRRLASSGAVAKVEEKVDTASDALQEQIDDIAEKAGSGYTPKGPASVATLNALSGQENGELYTMTDAGTLTDGSLAVVAGDTVAWDATNEVWYKAMDYAPRQYGTNEAHNLPTTITAFRTGDVIPVDGPSGTAKMSKDDLLKETAENTLGGIHSISQTANDDDLVAGNYLALNGENSLKKLSAEYMNKYFSDLTGNAQINKTIDLSVGVGNVVDIERPNTANNWMCVVVPCSQGDLLEIGGLGGNNARLFGVVDNEDKLVYAVSASILLETPVRYRVTTNGKVIFNCLNASPYKVFKKLVKLEEFCKDNLDKINKLDGYAEYYQQDIDYNAHHYINTNVNVGEAVSLEPVYSYGWQCIVRDCEQFDKFRITGTGGTNPKVWAFVDENLNLLSKSSGNSASQIVEAPADGKIICNFAIAYESSFAKKVSIQTGLDALTEDIAELAEEKTKLVDLNVDQNLVDVSDAVSDFVINASAGNTIMQQVYSKLDSLVGDFPSMVSKFDAAEFLEIAYPAYADYKLYCYKVNLDNSFAGNDSVLKKKKLMIISGVHGSEIAAPINLSILIERLCKNPASDVNLFNLLSSFEIFLIPCVNGYGMNNYTRVNYNGVDLNRNFPVLGWSQSGAGTQNYTGPSAGSEFETQVVCGIFDFVQPSVFIDHHNYSYLKRQWYDEISDEILRNIAYQSLTECSSVFKKDLPSYFGTSFALLKDEAGGAPKYLTDSSDGKSINYSHEQGCVCSAIVEIADRLNYSNGIVDESAQSRDAFGNDTFSIGEFTLRSQILRICDVALGLEQ